jgi:hypothetical protein
MNKAFLCLLFVPPLLLIPSLLPAAEPEVGDGKAAVVRVLGQPKGEMLNSKKEVLYYSRGLVDLQLGKVTQVDLLSEAELAELKRQIALMEEIKELEAEADREARNDKGREELARILGDEVFETRPASVRLHVWEAFKARYPDVELDEFSYQRALEEDQVQRAKDQVVMLKRVEEEAAKLNDPGPRPKISSKRVKKMKRAGTWKWDEEEKK